MGCVAALTLSACSGPFNGSADSTSGVAAKGDSAAGGNAAAARALDSPGAVPQANTDNLQAGVSGSTANTSQLQLAPSALIKTAAVTLESNDVGGVVARIDELTASIGGSISSEDTSTNSEGRAVRSRIQLKVPVADFDDAVQRIADSATLVSRSKSTQDVTGRVAEVSSRVTSARAAIEQLRLLFDRATKLSDVIDLERELSTRQADLEALLAEQRTLGARTTMSTITVNISQPPKAMPTPKADKRGGFISGIKQGWDGLVTLVVTTAHTLGLVLPLGTLGVVLALVVRLVVRRFMPRRVPPPVASE